MGQTVYSISVLALSPWLIQVPSRRLFKASKLPSIGPTSSVRVDGLFCSSYRSVGNGGMGELGIGILTSFIIALSSLSASSISQFSGADQGDPIAASSLSMLPMVGEAMETGSSNVLSLGVLENYPYREV